MVEYLQRDKVCMWVYRLVLPLYLDLSNICTFYLLVSYSLDEEIVPRVPGIKLGRFQVNNPYVCSFKATIILL